LDPQYKRIYPTAHENFGPNQFTEQIDQTGNEAASLAVDSMINFPFPYLIFIPGVGRIIEKMTESISMEHQ